MSRRALVIKLAPAAPACFRDQRAWLDFLSDAADEQRGGHRGPLNLRTAEPSFNYEFDFCGMCSAHYALAQQAKDKCHPWHLKELHALVQAAKVTP